MATTKSKTSTTKLAKKPKTTPANSSSRQVKPLSKITSAPKLFWQSLKLLKQHWKLFGVMTLIYGLLTIILVRGLSSGINLGNLKSTLSITKGSNSISTGITLFGDLLGGSNAAASQGGSAYQSMLVIVMSLATIWALRQLLADKKIRAKQAFYNGLYPLVPFILVLLVIGLQLLPLVIGSWLFATVIGTSIAVHAFEKIGWGLLFFLLAVWSLYMVCSSVFGLYIVTLPDMTPFKALRSAKELVRHRRFKILPKLLFLPLALFVIGAVITIPLILLLTPIAAWLYFALSLCALVVVHAYMYTLYRELL